MDDAARRIEGPVRTCIGCRGKDGRSALLRIVASQEDTGRDRFTLVLDTRKAMPGRGCWLHPDMACYDTAARRSAFARALRISGPVDSGPLRDVIAALTPDQHQETGSGFDADEHPMSTQK